jgi:DNA-binding NarL/FixJ family response regulator
MTGPIRVLLVDDHDLVRAGIAALLRNFPEVEVAAEARTGSEAILLTESHRPQVVLMDIAMPDMNGLVATARIVKEHPESRVMILSAYANEEYVREALRAGAVGYLLKGASPIELELAIRSVAQGDFYFSPSVSKCVADLYRQSKTLDANPLDRLTPRHREVLQLIAEGHSTKDMAQKLNLSVKTVETHRAQLMNRLDIHDIPGLVRFAVRHGLVTAE